MIRVHRGLLITFVASMSAALVASNAAAGGIKDEDCPTGCKCDNLGVPECYYVKLDSISKIVVMKREVKQNEIPNLIKELQNIQAKAE